MLHRPFVVLLLAAAALVLPAPAQAAACAGTSGVTVVVDFDDGTVQVGCAPGDPASGYAALIKAGFALTYAQGNGTGALCSINRVPDHACPSMPPASEYWAYFHAKPGGTWGYSSYGGNSYDPKPGTVEGWHYRGSPSDPPGIDPPGSTSTPKPSPTATATPTRQPTARPTSGTSAAPGPGSASVQAPGGTPTAPDATASSPEATGSPTAVPSARATDVSREAEAGAAEAATESVAARKPEAESAGGSSWIWGLVLIGVLGGSAGVAAARRRKA